MAGVDVACFTNTHHACPTACNQSTRARTCNGGGGIHAAGPVRGNEVLVAAERGIAIENGGVSFRCEAIFVSVTADACNSFEAEIEELGVEAGFLQEGDEE